MDAFFRGEGAWGPFFFIQEGPWSPFYEILEATQPCIHFTMLANVKEVSVGCQHSFRGSCMLKHVCVCRHVHPVECAPGVHPIPGHQPGEAAATAPVAAPHL